MLKHFPESLGLLQLQTDGPKISQTLQVHLTNTMDSQNEKFSNIKK
jgi:hypothetical protein